MGGPSRDGHIVSSTSIRKHFNPSPGQRYLGIKHRSSFQDKIGTWTPQQSPGAMVFPRIRHLDPTPLVDDPRFGPSNLHCTPEISAMFPPFPFHPITTGKSSPPSVIMSKLLASYLTISAIFSLVPLPSHQSKLQCCIVVAHDPDRPPIVLQ